MRASGDVIFLFQDVYLGFAGWFPIEPARFNS